MVVHCWLWVLSGIRCVLVDDKDQVVRRVSLQVFLMLRILVGNVGWLVHEGFG